MYLRFIWFIFIIFIYFSFILTILIPRSQDSCRSLSGFYRTKWDMRPHIYAIPFNLSIKSYRKSSVSLPAGAIIPVSSQSPAFPICSKSPVIIKNRRHITSKSALICVHNAFRMLSARLSAHLIVEKMLSIFASVSFPSRFSTRSDGKIYLYGYFPFIFLVIFAFMIYIETTTI